jgi:hypothetical protein
LLGDLPSSQQAEVIDYIESNHERLRELSLRMALKIGSLRKQSSEWKKLANVTCCR